MSNQKSEYQGKAENNTVSTEDLILDDDEHDYDSDTQGKGTVFSGFLNLSNTIIGSGILGLPSAFMGLGYVMGTVFVVLCGLMSAFTLHLLSKCSHKIGGRHHSYGSVAHASVPWLSWFVDLVVIFNCFGAGVSYLIIFGDNMPDFMEYVAKINDPDSIWLNRHLWISVAFVVFGIPLTVAPRLDFLKYTSFLALVSVTYCMILVILFWAEPSAEWNPCADYTDESSCRGPSEAFNSNFLDIFKALPVYVFAFCCHYNIFGIYNEMRVQTVRSMDFVVSCALCFVGSMYIVFGLGGYLTYGTETKSNILLNFPLNTVSSIARFAISFVVAVSYPLMTHPVRSAMLHLYDIIISRFGSEEKSEKAGKIAYWVCTVIVLAVTYVIAMLVTDLGFVFGVIGATASSMIAFVLPGVFYVMQYKGETKDSAWEKVLFYGAWFFIAFGIVFSVIATYVMFV
ncbi:hypothetical protein SARC_05390 [Sphaeroforma arctica JP610]|uniref:Amino acid transporter transmembrane domain-containing protein n=1 Tax=Sphaeroforma arctica JP610 TaxID=667725 RepID=A0A0L0G0F7_9EUKA|nr:hypothetical protein SARC_05390 [Sphaeroforma arctica JP610]KNC82326.1 hypothetical protein SARC_05390 [Sphaeroforma arctica JP610]|eukprot:XP_014156228.1 hypothetical protein SARC_05390 [Sphaeroforma arctica JP610]